MELPFLIRENSRMAWLAAHFMKVDRIAIVLGKTVHLYNTDRASFLNNQAWVNHEMVHVQQFKRYGFLRFIVLYLWECCRHGYYNNKYEIEARSAE
jgi:hypothetical protein